MKKNRKSITGSILQQATMLLPAKLLIDYADVIDKEINKKSGIYALYNNKELYYVGLTRNLKKRLNRHLQNRHAGKWNKFRIFLIKIKHLRDVESIILTISIPRGNKKGGILPKRGELDKKIKTAISQKSRNLKRLQHEVWDQVSVKKSR